MGYINYSRSVNSAAARDYGMVTKTDLTKEWLLSNAEEKEAFLINKMPLYILKKILEPFEWHHTSKFYNKTYYYDQPDCRWQLGELYDECLKEENGELTIVIDHFDYNLKKDLIYKIK